MNDQLLTQLLSYQEQMTRNLMLNALMSNPIERSMLSMLSVPNSNLLRPTFPLQHLGKINPAATMLRSPQLLMGNTFFKPELLNPATNQMFKERVVTPVSVLPKKATNQNEDLTAKAERPKQTNLALNPISARSEEISSPDTKDEVASLVSSGKEFSDYDEEADPDYHRKGVKKVQAAKKIKKKRNTCGHTDRKHYAKGLCSLCYHKKSRDQKPRLCSHEKLYARDLCQKCYANKYRNKDKEVTEEKQD